MMNHVQELVEVGKSYPANAVMDFKRLTLSATAVMDAIRAIASDDRTTFKKHFLDILCIGGGVSSDGMTHKATGDHYYDFVLD